MVSLDTNCVDPLDEATMGCDGPAMVEWLRADLSASAAPWKLVLIHRPALATGRYGTSSRVAASLVPVFEGGGVDLVLQGHNHFYERSWPTRGREPVQRGYVEAGAPVYVTSGGGGDWVYDSSFPAESWTAFRATEYQHLIVTLEGGTLRVECVRPDGSPVDSFELVKEVPPPRADLDAGGPLDGGAPAAGEPPGYDAGEDPAPGAGALDAGALRGPEGEATGRWVRGADGCQVSEGPPLDEPFLLVAVSLALGLIGSRRRRWTTAGTGRTWSPWIYISSCTRTAGARARRGSVATSSSSTCPPGSEAMARGRGRWPTSW